MGGGGHIGGGSTGQGSAIGGGIKPNGPLSNGGGGGGGPPSMGCGCGGMLGRPTKPGGIGGGPPSSSFQYPNKESSGNKFDCIELEADEGCSFTDKYPLSSTSLFTKSH